MSSILIEVRPLPVANTSRADVPCPVLSHIWRIAPHTTSLLSPILYCPACGWSYCEVVADEAKCSERGCKEGRTGGTAKCATHGALIGVTGVRTT